MILPRRPRSPLTGVANARQGWARVGTAWMAAAVACGSVSPLPGVLAGVLLPGRERRVSVRRISLPLAGHASPLFDERVASRDQRRPFSHHSNPLPREAPRTPPGAVTLAPRAGLAAIQAGKPLRGVRLRARPTPRARPAGIRADERLPTRHAGRLSLTGVANARPDTRSRAYATHWSGKRPAGRLIACGRHSLEWQTPGWTHDRPTFVVLRVVAGPSRHGWVRNLVPGFCDSGYASAQNDKGGQSLCAG